MYIDDDAEYCVATKNHSKMTNIVQLMHMLIVDPNMMKMTKNKKNSMHPY